MMMEIHQMELEQNHMQSLKQGIDVCHGSVPEWFFFATETGRQLVLVGLEIAVDLAD